MSGTQTIMIKWRGSANGAILIQIAEEYSRMDDNFNSFKIIISITCGPFFLFKRTKDCKSAAIVPTKFQS
jgi:hypothetical protein